MQGAAKNNHNHDREGIIVLVDEVGFSQKPDSDQRIIVERLLQHASEFSWKQISRSAVHINPTGDGYLLTVHNGSVGYREALALAEQAVSLFSTKKLARGLSEDARSRAAVHFGKFQRVELRGLEDGKSTALAPVSIGSGPNAAARIASIGDGGQVVVSSEFLEDWLNEQHKEYEKEIARFLPTMDRDPFRVWVKHDEQRDVRFFCKSPNSEDLPPKIRQAQAAENRLYESLRAIATGFVAGVWRETQSESSTPEEFAAAPLQFEHRLQVRVSLYHPKPGKASRVLVCQHRYRHADQSTGTGGKSSYSWADPKGEGPVGDAFRAREPRCVVDIPTDLKLREQVLAEWRLRDIAKNWGRGTRSLAAFPVSLLSDTADEVPDACICIDCMEPLPITSEKVCMILALLRKDWGPTIAAFWRLRRT